MTKIVIASHLFDCQGIKKGGLEVLSKEDSSKNVIVNVFNDGNQYVRCRYRPLGTTRCGTVIDWNERVQCPYI